MTTATDEKQIMLDWLTYHDACEEGVAWARDNCSSLGEAWQTCRPEWLFWMATRRGVLTDRELMLFACQSVRQVWHLLTDDRSRQAVIVAERYLVGEADRNELNAAASAAWASSRDACAAAWASGASSRAACAAAGSSGASSRAAALADQAKWLRKNTTPSFNLDP